MMKYIFFVFVVLLSVIGFAQEVKILDKETGKKVKNVTVYNKSRTVSLTTNKNGTVNVSAFNENEIIVFSHLSYANKSIKKCHRHNFGVVSIVNFIFISFTTSN